MDFQIVTFATLFNFFYDMPAKLRFHQFRPDCSIIEIRIKKNFIEFRNKHSLFYKIQISAIILASRVFAIFFGQRGEIFSSHRFLESFLRFLQGLIIHLIQNILRNFLRRFFCSFFLEFQKRCLLYEFFGFIDIFYPGQLHNQPLFIARFGGINYRFSYAKSIDAPFNHVLDGLHRFIHFPAFYIAYVRFIFQMYPALKIQSQVYLRLIEEIINRRHFFNRFGIRNQPG